MAGLKVAPDVNDELDVPAALPPQLLTGRHSTKHLRELRRKLCWPETDDRHSPRNLVRRGETRKFEIARSENCGVSFT
jgi:hypothetical protein